MSIFFYCIYCSEKYFKITLIKLFNKSKIVPPKQTSAMVYVTWIRWKHSINGLHFRLFIAVVIGCSQSTDSKIRHFPTIKIYIPTTSVITWWCKVLSWNEILILFYFPPKLSYLVKVTPTWRRFKLLKLFTRYLNRFPLTDSRLELVNVFKPMPEKSGILGWALPSLKYGTFDRGVIVFLNYTTIQMSINKVSLLSLRRKRIFEGVIKPLQFVLSSVDVLLIISLLW